VAVGDGIGVGVTGGETVIVAGSKVGRGAWEGGADARVGEELSAVEKSAAGISPNALAELWPGVHAPKPAPITSVSVRNHLPFKRTPKIPLSVTEEWMKV
jgi:hypothetical protein